MQENVINTNPVDRFFFKELHLKKFSIVLYTILFSRCTVLIFQVVSFLLIINLCIVVTIKSHLLIMKYQAQIPDYTHNDILELVAVRTLSTGLVLHTVLDIFMRQIFDLQCELLYDNEQLNSFILRMNLETVFALKKIYKVSFEISSHNSPNRTAKNSIRNHSD